MNRVAAVSLLVLTPALAGADSVFLKNGGELKGEVVEQRADAVVMEVGPGRVTVPMKNVARIVSSTTDLGVFHARAAALAPRDVAGWLSLAAWAQRRNLATQAREAYEHVLDVDPMNADAHLALGNVRMGDRWLSGAEANRARGLVEFEGTWMTPEERQMRFEERAAAAQERMAMREGEARAREAEARAREASARADAAEADLRASAEQPVDGIPLGVGYGGYGPIIAGPYNPFPNVPPRPRPGMGHGHGQGQGHRPPPPAPPRSDRRDPPPTPAPNTVSGAVGPFASHPSNR